MGKYFHMIANEPIDSPLGQIVLKQLAAHRALGNTPNPETVAHDSYNVLLGNMQRQELEIAALKKQQAQRATQEIRASSVPVEATKPAARKVISVPGKITIKQSAPQAVKAAAVTPVKQAAPVVTPLKSSRGSMGGIAR